MGKDTDNNIIPIVLEDKLLSSLDECSKAKQKCANALKGLKENSSCRAKYQNCINELEQCMSGLQELQKKYRTSRFIDE